MIFVHRQSAISPQQTFSEVALHDPKIFSDNKLKITEPQYSNIPINLLRRMGKAVRIAMAAALDVAEETNWTGIIVGTSNGGFEDSIKFLNQIVEYDEGVLTPTGFVQGTQNSIASQIAMLKKNEGYNATHVHRGLAFENAVLDAMMLLKENPNHNYILGGVDEISDFTFNIESLGGWYKNELVASDKIYESSTSGTIAGESAVMFLVNSEKESSLAKVSAINFFQTQDPWVFSEKLNSWLKKLSISPEMIDILFSGESGDSGSLHFYEGCEKILGDISVARFKHLTGDHPTVSSMALWLAVHILQEQKIYPHMIKRKGKNEKLNTILIYNNYKGLQHSFILVEKS